MHGHHHDRYAATPPDRRRSHHGLGVALIYMNIMAYNFSWAPLPLPIVSEIFPARIEEIGVATGVGSQWLSIFM
ncbi:hypothetical protein DFH06DRAFT_1320766 [Mycena polygramma]|nr:hypothetical protein DFH06DRAFT_1320766 [Mycena polygramma]